VVKTDAGQELRGLPSECSLFCSSSCSYNNIGLCLATTLFVCRFSGETKFVINGWAFDVGRLLLLRALGKAWGLLSEVQGYLGVMKLILHVLDICTFVAEVGKLHFR
jgi:hypothetical protein